MSVGVAFSGGGVKGAYHIGVLRALEEAGIDVEYVSGTSSGAIVASLFASGFSWASILNIFNFYARKIVCIDNKSILKALINAKNGSRCINKFDNFEGILKSVFSSKKVFDINDISMKLVVSSVDINSGKVVYFGNSENLCVDENEVYECGGMLYKIVRASAAYPVLFEPSFYRGRVLVDGGVRKNLPVSILKSMGAEKIIAVDVSNEILPLKSISMLNVGLRCIDIMGKCNNEEEYKKADLLIRPTNISHIGMLDFDYINALATEGYYATKKIIDKIKCLYD